MPTKLSRLCLGVMEAAWLAAVSIVPIFFNILSSRIFEPDKIAILRSLALLTLAAWAIKLIDKGGVRWKAENNDASLIKYLLQYPLIAPVIGLVIVYSLSTIFSVTPSISFFGSWQRLQGTYTTFSYLVIFLSIVANMRRRQQINRLVTTVILASLPVSLYGLLQHYQIDPIPWGGNVSIRIAANMGNSIFVAAYLIMVFPLTLGRMIEAFRAILSDNNNTATSLIVDIKQIIRATIYVFIAALELIAIYMSGSRGPLLGLMAGIYFMLLLFSIYWKKRWLTFITIAVAVVGAAFLVVFNINNGPFEALRKSPAIGRFGNLLNSESNSALVRQYIWEGTVKLVEIHEPLQFPDGSTDKFNFLRPIFGYGPESMYVAFNQFYVPELGQVEKRNASPDRSHNETWDSIVFTGLSGLFVYLSIFASIFYYGLKWLGLINTQQTKIFFFTCLMGGGVIGSITLIALKGVEFLGVGLPFGMIVGIVIYLTVYTLFALSRKDDTHSDNPYIPILIVLLSAIVGHFVEINFGIAIVATRTLFWTYAGMILVTGFILPKALGADIPATQLDKSTNIESSSFNKKQGKPGSYKTRRSFEESKRPLFGDLPDSLREILISAIIMGIILATLGYDYINNSSHSNSFISIIINSLTRLPNKENILSFGIILLIFITWIAGVLLFSTESEAPNDGHSWLQKIGVMSVISISIGVIFWILHGLSLAVLGLFQVTSESELLSQVNRIGNMLDKYYIYIFLVIILLAFLLPDEWTSRKKPMSIFNAILVPIALGLVFVATNYSNLRVIDADITFKMAEPFTQNGQWQIATILYKRSLELAPTEDHYYLFLGRSYLEQAKITESVPDQDALVLEAEKDLQVAQSINPLNTDHTANLARLYSWWAGKATSATTREERSLKASQYYDTALKLSPNHSTLWDEWAVVYMQLLNQPEQALVRLNHALQLDQKYSFTQGLLGDYYMRVANSTDDIPAKEEAYLTAAGYYRTAAEDVKSTDTVSKASYLVSLGNALSLSATVNPQYINSVQLQQAIGALKEAIDAKLSSSDLWKVQQAIAKLYLQLGDKSNAQYYANFALQTAPETAASQIQDLLEQIQKLP